MALRVGALRRKLEGEAGRSNGRSSAMPLYEIVLCFPDREEVRLTDSPVTVGERVSISGDEWSVVVEREPEDIRATARFLCELTKQQRERDRKVRDADAARRRRLAERHPDIAEPS